MSSLAPGTTKQLVVKDLKAGHYALVCALPGHYQAGMYADFTVG
ncbi:MAG: sulfocyanin-like copper-binding protein [Conexibacter sp.]